MKKLLLSTGLPICIILGAILIIGPGCPGGPVTPAFSCNTSNTAFITLYNAYPPADNYSIDKQVYEYTFKTNVNGSICAVGYQGNSNLAGIPAYQIDLIDPASNTILSTGTYTFGSAAINYQNITPVSIIANQPYLLRRTVVNNLGNVGNTVSHYKPIPGPFAPIVNGPLTIMSTKVYEQYAQPAPYNISTNVYLPCIDFVFN